MDAEDLALCSRDFLLEDLDVRFGSRRAAEVSQQKLQRCSNIWGGKISEAISNQLSLIELKSAVLEKNCSIRKTIRRETTPIVVCVYE